LDHLVRLVEAVLHEHRMPYLPRLAEMTVAELRVLWLVAEAESLDVEVVAERLGLAPSHRDALLDRLAAAGLVERDRGVVRALPTGAETIASLRAPGPTPNG